MYNEFKVRVNCFLCILHSTPFWTDFHLHKQCYHWPIRERWLMVRINIMATVVPPSTSTRNCTVRTPNIIVIIICTEFGIVYWFIACCKIITTSSSISNLKLCDIEINFAQQLLKHKSQNLIVLSPYCTKKKYS